jgi:hypothetical protein
MPLTTLLNNVRRTGNAVRRELSLRLNINYLAP